jgi:hypothetical protein
MDLMDTSKIPPRDRFLFSKIASFERRFADAGIQRALDAGRSRDP